MASKKYAKDALEKLALNRPAVARGIPAKVVDALLAAFGVDEAEITLDTQLSGDLGLDSLDLCELAMDLEQAYGVSLPDRILESWGAEGTVQTVLTDLRQQGAKL